MSRASGNEEPERPVAGIYERLAKIQEKTALMPDYGLKAVETAVATTEPATKDKSAQWPAVSAGKSAAGLIGGLLTLVLAGLIGYALRRCGSVKSEAARPFRPPHD